MLGMLGSFASASLKGDVAVPPGLGHICSCRGQGSGNFGDLMLFNNFNKLRLLFLHNNPVCKISSEKVKEIVIHNKGDQETTGCVAQCSEYCQDLWLSYKTCWPQCNTPKCFKIREEKYGKVDCA